MSFDQRWSLTGVEEREFVGPPVVISIFHGPLDLLVYLLRRHQLNIQDVPVADVVGQFVQFVRAMQLLRIEEAAEFLPVAAALVLWKVRSLLPGDGEQQTDEIEEELAVENIVAAAREQAEEYLTYRAIAECLRQAREERERIFIRSADVEEIESGWVTIEDASVFDMVAALARVLERMERRPTAVLMRPRWSIRGQILYIRQRLKETDGRQLSFEDLFDQASDRLWVVVTFLALLELIRRGEVGVAVVEDGSVAVYARE